MRVVITNECAPLDQMMYHCICVCEMSHCWSWNHGRLKIYNGNVGFLAKCLIRTAWQIVTFDLGKLLYSHSCLLWYNNPWCWYDFQNIFFWKKINGFDSSSNVTLGPVDDESVMIPDFSWSWMQPMIPRSKMPYQSHQGQFSVFCLE